MPALHQDVLVQVPCGILSFTETGLITSANEYCCNILGYERAELAGKKFPELLSVSGRIFYQTHFYPIVKLHGHTEEIFFNLRTKKGADVPVLLNAIVASGAFEVICSFIPVFNRRKYEDEILLAKKKAEDALQKNELLENVQRELQVQQKELDKQITLLKYQNQELIKLNDLVSHDLQEPVRKLILFANELQHRAVGENFAQHALSVIESSSQRIRDLLLNLQSYLSLTEQAPSPGQVNLEELVQSQLDRLRGLYDEVNLKVERDPLPLIEGNKKQLSCLFYHLLKNAFDHAATEGSLHINIQAVVVKENLFNTLETRYQYADYLQVTISDTGPGFDHKYNEYIFEVLKRLDVTGNTLGFGLAFCKRIAEIHFGKIWAQGQPGKGASFVVMLPLKNIY